MTEILCAGCGKPIETTWAGKRYHGQECFDLHYKTLLAASASRRRERTTVRRAARLAAQPKHWCAWCGETIDAHPGATEAVAPAAETEFCSADCESQYHTDRWREQNRARRAAG